MVFGSSKFKRNNVEDEEDDFARMDSSRMDKDLRFNQSRLSGEGRIVQ